MPLVPPPPDFSGWYLRGDIGFTNQMVGSLFNVNYADFPDYAPPPPPLSSKG